MYSITIKFVFIKYSVKFLKLYKVGKVKSKFYLVLKIDNHRIKKRGSYHRAPDARGQLADGDFGGNGHHGNSDINYPSRCPQKGIPEASDLNHCHTGTPGENTSASLSYFYYLYLVGEQIRQTANSSDSRTGKATCLSSIHAILKIFYIYFNVS